jgi:hypothetical protein
MTMKSSKSLVIIPAYSEEKNIQFVIDEVSHAVPDFNILVIDDGSLDATAFLARQYGAEVLTHAVNLGYGAAVQTGLKYAVQHEYGIIVIMDADGQHDANDIPVLVDALARERADIVIGSRYLKRGDYKTTPLRALGVVFFSFLTYLIIHKRMSDITSGFQAMNTVAARFLSINYPVDFPDAEIIILLSLSGFDILEVPSRFRQRISGKSMFTLPKALYYPFKAMLAIFIVLLKALFWNKETNKKCQLLDK